jgi:hypothetical protein
MFIEIVSSLSSFDARALRFLIAYAAWCSRLSGGV